MVYIANQQARAPVSSRDIVEAYRLPPRYLEQILQSLVREGLLRGVRGPRGGYLLAKEKRRISLLEIYEIVEDKTAEGSASAAGCGKTSQMMHALWEKSHDQFRKELAKITLEQACKQGGDTKMAVDSNAHYVI